jgi:hypothetical protein
MLAGLSLPAYVAALFELLVFAVITLSFIDVIKGRKYLAAVAVAAKLAVFMAFATNAANGTNWAFISEFIKGDSALIAYIRTGEYAGGPDIERFFEIVFTCLALLGYLVFFISYPGDKNREDPYAVVNTKVMVFVSAISLGAAQICWIDRMIAKLNALTGARRRSALREMLRIIFIPLYYIYWIDNRGRIAREEGLKMGYALPNRGVTSAVLSIFTLGIAGSALLQSNLNIITTGSHELAFEEVNEPGDYAENEPFIKLPVYESEDQDDLMFKPENRQYADESPDAQPPAILPSDPMGYDDSAYSESPTLQYPYVGLPVKQEPKLEDKKWESTALPDSPQPQRPKEGMSITEASSRLEGLKSVMEAIRELSDLKSEGLITDDEFNKTKLELLSRL